MSTNLSRRAFLGTTGLMAASLAACGGGNGGGEGGDEGGELVFAGTPEDCARCEASYTGQYLKQVLDPEE